MASFARTALGVAAAGVSAATAAAVLAGAPFRLEPGRRPWSPLVRGSAEGTIRGRVVAFLPGLDRQQGAVLWLETAGQETGTLAVAVDDSPAEWVALRPGVIAAVAVPASRVPGARLALATMDGPPPRLHSIRGEPR